MEVFPRAAALLQLHPRVIDFGHGYLLPSLLLADYPQFYQDCICYIEKPYIEN